MSSSLVEDGVTTNEFYYLLLVLGAFGAFAVGISLALVQDRAWVRRQAAATVAASRSPSKVDRSPRARSFADAA
jgi:hypothetical protein